MIMDIAAVGIVVLAAIAALVFIFVKWEKEKKLFGEKRKQLIEESKKVENSSLVG
jgi:hypothetical protein